VWAAVGGGWGGGGCLQAPQGEGGKSEAILTQGLRHQMLLSWAAAWIPNLGVGMS